MIYCMFTISMVLREAKENMNKCWANLPQNCHRRNGWLRVSDVN